MAQPGTLEDLVELPTLARLGVKVAPENIDAQAIAAGWVHKFSEALVSNQIDSILHLLLEDVLWRDLLPLTWDIRTFFGTSTVRSLLESRLSQSKLSNIRISTNKDKAATLFDSVPGLLWIQAFFDFDCAAGPCTGICRIVPTPSGEWKAHSICTILEELKGRPFATGRHRDCEPDQSKWKKRRQEENAFAEKDPRVVVIGGGQVGLNIAARLKYIGIPNLIIDKHDRIGDEWRNRYRTLSLHDPVYVHHLAFLPFPPTWPLFPSASKFADWLEFYAKVMDLNVWTSSEVTKIQRDDEKNQWVLTVNDREGSVRTLRPTYVVLAMGFPVPKIPSFPGMDTFGGQVLHSTSFKKASDFQGKKVVVVGACTSGHDIAQDCYETGLDVTMVQRSPTCIYSVKAGLKVLFADQENGPPLEIADRIAASYPLYLAKRTHQLAVKRLKVYDQPLHDALQKVGFKASWGPDDSGYLLLAATKTGGYYIDTGACQLIIDGKIKIKGGKIREFTKDGLVFEDDSSLTADVVILATGVQCFQGNLFDPDMAAKLLPIRSRAEGEFQWLNTGLKNVYTIAGNLMTARFYSLQVALHIKAKEEGIYTNMYELPEDW